MVPRVIRFKIYADYFVVMIDCAVKDLNFFMLYAESWLIQTIVPINIAETIPDKIITTLQIWFGTRSFQGSLKISSGAF